MNLGKVGIWTFALDVTPWPQAVEVLAEVEELGYGAVWVPEVVAKDALVHCGAAAVGERADRGRHRHRLHLGPRPPRHVAGAQDDHRGATRIAFCWVSASATSRWSRAFHGADYAKPYSKMREYLDAMDQAPYFAAPPTAEPQRVLAALGPRMLELAATRANGAHPYFVPVRAHRVRPRHPRGGPLSCARSRRWCSPPTPPRRAIPRAGPHDDATSGCPTTRTTSGGSGYGDDDFAGGGSDRLFDAIVAWGDVDAIAARVKAAPRRRRRSRLHPGPRRQPGPPPPRGVAGARSGAGWVRPLRRPAPCG